MLFRSLRTRLFLLVFCYFPLNVLAQNFGFKYGEYYISEFNTQTFPLDTAASAIVLNEYGYSYFENDNNYNLISMVHFRVKILRKDGLEKANVEIPLFKNGLNSDVLRDVQAQTMNMENGTVKNIPWSRQRMVTEKRNERWDVVKVILPEVRVGSIIEVMYTIESSYFFNFKNWYFQSDIPKLKSTYRADIPGNYRYNISLRGPLKLSRNTSEIIMNCFTPGGNKADCVSNIYEMVNIPAFQEEEFMTSEENFISQVKFELSEVLRFDGRSDQYTKTWKDLEQEMKREPRFGMQLKKGEGLLEGKFTPTAGLSELNKAREIYDFIRNKFRWNEQLTKYASERGIRKAFEEGKGSVGDINLTLIAVLRSFGYQVDPVLLSTRENGTVSELFPVLSEFDYVIARVKIGDKYYFLDATDDTVPFGLLPMRCLNGKGRLMLDEGSSWIPLTASEKRKVVTNINLNISTEGVVSGTIHSVFMGHRAAQVRHQIRTSGNGVEDYIKSLDKELPFRITGHSYTDLDSTNKPLVEDLNIEFDEPIDWNNTVLFTPFVVERWEHNPFKMSKRTYPVDFGTGFEETVQIIIKLPTGKVLKETFPDIGLSLPGNSGKFIYQTRVENEVIRISSSLVINKPEYAPNEYFWLKELFTSVVESQGRQLYLGQ